MKEQKLACKILLEHVRDLVSKKYAVHSDKSNGFSFDYEDITYRLKIQDYCFVSSVVIEAYNIVNIQDEDDIDKIIASIRLEEQSAIYFIDEMNYNNIAAKVYAVIENKYSYTLKIHDSLCVVLYSAVEKGNLIGNIHKKIIKF